MKAIMRCLRLLVVLIAAAALAQGAAGAPMAQSPAPIVVQGVGLQTPESVLYDRRDDVYLVSNINGNPTGADGNGFISRIAPGGKVLALKWIDGTKQGVTLNAPKGMAIAGDVLYVTDIMAVRMFDRRTGRPRGSIDIPASTFLNDATAGRDGSVYITDSGWKPDFSPSGTDAVYRISGGKLTQIAKGAALKTPNGLAVLPNGTLVIVSGGATGEYYTLGPGGQPQDARKLSAGQLDGVEVLPGGALLVSSWAASAVYRVERSGEAKVVVKDVQSPADIGYDSKRQRVLIPLFLANRVVIQPLR